MTIRVSPTEPNPTHDISLSDGTTTIGLHLVNGQGLRDRRAIRQTSTPRTSLQIQQGDPNYSGFNLPYTPITQKDWSGGRGQKDFRLDGAKYYDGYGVNTIHGRLFLAPKATLTTSDTIESQAANGYQNHTQTTGTVEYFATSFVPTEDIDIERIRIKAGYTDDDYDVFTVAIHDDSSGTPGTQKTLFTPSTLYDDGGNPIDRYYWIPGPPGLTTALTAGTRYWVHVTMSNLASGTYSLGINNSAPDFELWHKVDTGPWTLHAADTCIDFTLYPSAPTRDLFFEYKGGLYLVRSTETGAAPKLFMNGYRAMATNSSTINTVDTTLDLTGEASHQGNVYIKIVSGKQYDERVAWREVAYISRPSNTTILVSEPWADEPDSTSQFVMLGYDTWNEVTGHGLTKPVTDVCVVGDYVYFAQGDSNSVIRGRLNGTTWENDAEGDTNAKATFIELIPQTDGTQKIWFAQASTSKVFTASPVTSWTDLTLTTSNGGRACGNAASKITNLIGYAGGGGARVPYILKEDGLGSIENDIYAEIPNAELSAVKSEDNGRAATVQGVYLFFSMMQSLERYYDQRLDDIGPGRGDGLPVTRRGPIVSAKPYPGGVLIGIDGGRDGYSSVMFWSSDTGGYCELFRGGLGERMGDMQIQVIPGEQYQRLWFTIGTGIYWMPMSTNPLKSEGYPFTSTGYLITSNFRTGLGEINKFFKSLMVFSELNGGSVTVSYQADSDIDDDGTWTALPSTFDTDPMEEILFSSGYSTTGKEIRLKITLARAGETTTPEVVATTINAVTRVPPSKTWGLTFAADDMNVQEGEADDDPLDMDGLLAQLEVWADSGQRAAPITMRSLIPQYDNKRVFIDMPNIQLREVQVDTDTRQVKSIGNLSLYEA